MVVIFNVHTAPLIPTTHWAPPPAAQAPGCPSLLCSFHLCDSTIPHLPFLSLHNQRKRMLVASRVASTESHPDNKPNTINSSESAAEALVTFVDALSPVPQQGIIAVCTNPCLLRPQCCLTVTDRIKRGLDWREVQGGFMAQYREMQILFSFKSFLCYHWFFFL